MAIRAGPILRPFGSLWFGAVLLMLLLVAMAYATVYESTRSTEQALFTFYHAWWFKWLLALVGLNVLASVAARWPLSKRQAGFVCTHGGLVLILVGALVTRYVGIDGRLGIVEGQSVAAISVPEETLTLRDVGPDDTWSMPLGALAGGFEAVERRSPLVREWGAHRIRVLRYLPDTIMQQQVVTDSPSGRAAVQVSLAGAATEAQPRVWLFEGQAAPLGPKKAMLRTIADPQEWQRLIASLDSTARSSKGMVTLALADRNFEVPLEDCLQRSVAVEDTGYTLKVLRYLPHATVGQDKQLHNVSDEPINPAIEVELGSPSGSEKRIAFAKFPDFQSMHLKKQFEAIKVTFVAPEQAARADLEVLCGPQDQLLVRFNEDLTGARELSLGQAVPAPWQGLQFAVHQRLEQAEMVWNAEQVTPLRKDRVPAVFVELATANSSGQIWLRKYRPRPLSIDGRPFELLYGDRSIPLDFEIKLNRFHIGYYPGGRRPRSFESHVTFIDPAAGSTHDSVISMNHPASFKGYTFYQSSYRQQPGQTTSFLSVARDPGMTIVFAGYTLTLVGMLIVLGIRMAERGRSQAQDGGVVHLQVGGKCQS